MNDELDPELQARLEAAAGRLAPKADGLEKVQRDGAARQTERRLVVSGLSVALFVAALGGGAVALSTIGDDPQEVLAAQTGDADDQPEDGDPQSGDSAPTSAADGGADGSAGQPSDEATTTQTMTPSTGTVMTPETDSGDQQGGTASTGTTIYHENGTAATSGGTANSSPTIGQAEDYPVVLTTIPLPPDADQRAGSWEYRYDFGAVQQWVAGNQECIRLYSPIKRDPARSEVTILQQSTFQACFDPVTTTEDWYVIPGNSSGMLFLLYALPPLDPVAIWVTDAAGYRVPGLVDGEFWGIDAYWSFKPVAVHIERSNGEVVSIDLPPASQQSNILRLYIGRAVGVG